MVSQSRALFKGKTDGGMLIGKCSSQSLYLNFNMVFGIVHIKHLF